MNEQANNYFGQIDLDKLWSMVQACPELVKTFNDKNGNAHHVISVNVGERKQASQNGNTHYIQIACKVADRKYDASAYYVGDLKPSGQSSQNSGNQPPMPASTPWGGAPAPAPQAPQAAPQPQYGQQAPAPGYQQQAPMPGYQQPAPQPQSGMPFPPPSGDPNAPF